MRTASLLHEVLVGSLLLTACGGGEEIPPPGPSDYLPRTTEVIVAGTVGDTATWLPERGQRTGAGTVGVLRRTDGAGVPIRFEVLQIDTEGFVRKAFGVESDLGTGLAMHRGSRSGFAAAGLVWGETQSFGGGIVRTFDAPWEVVGASPFAEGGLALLMRTPGQGQVLVTTDSAGQLTGVTEVLEELAPLGLAPGSLLRMAPGPSGDDVALVAHTNAAGHASVSLVDGSTGDLRTTSLAGLVGQPAVLPAEATGSGADEWVAWNLSEGGTLRPLLTRIGVSEFGLPTITDAHTLELPAGFDGLEVLDLVEAGALDDSLAGSLLVCLRFWQEGTSLQTLGLCLLDPLLDPADACLWTVLAQQSGTPASAFVARPEAASAGAQVVWALGGVAGAPYQGVCLVDLATGEPQGSPNAWSGIMAERPPVQVGTAWSWESSDGTQWLLGAGLEWLGGWRSSEVSRTPRLSWAHRSARTIRGLTPLDPFVSALTPSGLAAHTTCLVEDASAGGTGAVIDLQVQAPGFLTLQAVGPVSEVIDPSPVDRSADLGWGLGPSPVELNGQAPNACD